MINDLINQIRAQQAGRETPLQMLWSGSSEGGAFSPAKPAHRSEGFADLPENLPFAVAVDEYASRSGRGYVIRIRAMIGGEEVEMTDQDGPLIWTQQSFRVEVRPKQFTGEWSGWGWRAEVIGNESRDMGVRSLAFYADPEHQNFLYTIGAAFTRQPSEYYPGVEVWAAETPEGQRTEERQEIHWAALYASLQEVKGSLGVDDEVSIGRYFMGLDGEQKIPEAPTTPAWQPGGGTLAAGSYAKDVRVTHPNAQDGGNVWLWQSTYAGNTQEPGTDGTFHRYWTPIEPI